MKWAKKETSGFTIVELLIVVVVIAILAAITITAYNGIQNRAKQSAAQSTAKQAFTKIQSYAVQNADTYPTDLDSAGLTASSTATYQYRVDNGANPRTFCLTATTQNLSYYVSNSTTTPIIGACPGHGANGVAVITNLMTNPSIESNTSGWNPNGTTTIAPSISRSYAGAQSVLLTTTGTTNIGVNLNGPTLVAGQTYTFSAYIYLVGTWPTGLRACAWGSAMSSIACGTADATTGQWRRVSITFTAQNSLPSTFYVYNGINPAPASGVTAYVDAVQLVEGSTPFVYADGSSEGWVWNGTQNNSSSSGPVL